MPLSYFSKEEQRWSTRHIVKRKPLGVVPWPPLKPTDEGEVELLPPSFP